MKNIWIKSFAAAAGLGIALNAGITLAQPDIDEKTNNDHIYNSVKVVTQTQACTADNFTVNAIIPVHPSTRDLLELSKRLQQQMLQNSFIQPPNWKEILGKDAVKAFMAIMPPETLQKEVNGLWAEIAGGLKREDFIEPNAEGYSYPPKVIAAFQQAGFKFQEKIENDTNGVSVLIGNVSYKVADTPGCPAPQ